MPEICSPHTFQVQGFVVVVLVDTVVAVCVFHKSDSFEVEHHQNKT